MSWGPRLALLVGLAADLAAADPVVPPELVPVPLQIPGLIVPADEDGPPKVGRRTSPEELLQPSAVRAGRHPPASAAAPGIVDFKWDDARTLVLIGIGVGVVRPAWVATLDGTTGQLQVCYPATAFLDSAGVLHIDARGSKVLGPKASNWSPDSFAVSGDQVFTMDDQPNHGGFIAPLTAVVPQALDQARYQQVRDQVLGFIGGD